MSIISVIGDNEDDNPFNRLPPAYDGCTCSCHRTPGVMHVMACCWPKFDPQPVTIINEKEENAKSSPNGD